MTTTLINFNRFKSTSIYGTFSNVDSSNGAILADAKFQRNLKIEGNLILGKETILDANGNPVNSESTIQFTLDNILYSIPLRTLSFIKNVTSDVQQQITNISNNNSVGNFTTIDFTTTINNISASTFSKISYLSTLSSIVQTQISNANTAIAELNFKTTNISWSVVPNQTTISNKLSTSVLTFSSSLNSISPTVFGYLSSVSSPIQDQLNTVSTAIASINSKTTDISWAANKTTINNQCDTNILTFSNTLNNISPTVFGYLSGVSSGIQSQISNANTAIANIAFKTTNISWSVVPNQTTISNTLSTNVLTFSSSLNSISPTVFGYLDGLTSNIQGQINSSNANISTVEYRTRDISWNPGQINTTTISNYCNTSYLSFSQSLNNISTTTFSYLSGLTSNVQDQINALKNTNPTGMVITYAGTSSTLTGYLLCDGSSYYFQQYPYLFNAIGYTYGGDQVNQYFKVPNYKGIFLRGAGQQNVQLNVIAGNGGPVFKSYQSPNLGTTVIDQSTEFTTSFFVDNINTQVRSVVTGSSAYVGTFSYTNAISSLNFSTNNNGFNYGNQETHPVHTSVQYFIKY